MTDTAIARVLAAPGFSLPELMPPRFDAITSDGMIIEVKTANRSRPTSEADLARTIWARQLFARHLADAAWHEGLNSPKT